MLQEQFDREVNYRTVMSIAMQMLERNLITKQEYRQIDTMFAEKYLPVAGQLMPASP